MEYTLSELLTRENLLHILRKRQLKIPNIEMLPTNELLNIYKIFAVPLVRRDKQKCKKYSLENENVNEKFYCKLDAAQKDNITEDAMECEEDLTTDIKNQCCEPLHMVSAKVKLSEENNLNKMTKCRKRIFEHYQNYRCPLTDDYLSLATKRIKISF